MVGSMSESRENGFTNYLYGHGNIEYDTSFPVSKHLGFTTEEDILKITEDNLCTVPGLNSRERKEIMTAVGVYRIMQVYFANRKAYGKATGMPPNTPTLVAMQRLLMRLSDGVT
jgi:hypothetical protein